MATAIACCLALVATSASAAASTHRRQRASASESPVNIGFVVPTTGTFAQIGDDMVNGANLAASQVNKEGGLDGHPIDIKVCNGQISTSDVVACVHSLASAGVKLFSGFIIDSTCLAAVPVLKELGVMAIGTSCQANSVHTSAAFYSRFFNIAPTNYMLSKATAVYAHEHFPDLATWKGGLPDYGYGHQVWTNFQDDLKKVEPKVKFDKGVFIPLTATQFGPYVTSIISGLPSNSASNTGLLISTFGQQTVGLVEAAKPVNMFSRFKVTINEGGSTPTAVALKTATPDLVFVYDYDNLAYHNAVNTKFVSSFESRFKSVPDAWAEEGYSVVLAYQAVANKAKSVSPSKLAKTLPGLGFPTPKGTLVFRKGDYVPETPVTVWEVKGDASAPGGFKILNAEAVPFKEIAPSVDLHP